jgi:hypothetical protein
MSEGVSPSPGGTRPGFSVNTHNLIGGLIVAVLALLMLGYAFLCAQHGHTAIDVGCFGRDRDCHGGWFGARPWAAGFFMAASLS